MICNAAQVILAIAIVISAFGLTIVVPFCVAIVRYTVEETKQTELIFEDSPDADQEPGD